MSVTVAAVSATPEMKKDYKKDDKKDDKKNDKKDWEKKDDKKRHDDKFKPKGHWEIIKVKHIVWKHGQKHVYFTFKKVWVANHYPVFHR